MEPINLVITICGFVLVIGTGAAVRTSVLKSNAETLRANTEAYKQQTELANTRATQSDKELTEVKDELKDLRRDFRTLKEDHEGLKDKYICVLEESRKELVGLCSEVRHQLGAMKDILAHNAVNQPGH
jgi:chromosome segregation ATPase